MRYFDILATRSSTFCLVQVGIIWIVILFVFVLFLITSCSNFHFLDGCFLLYPLLEDYCSPACNPTAIPTVFRGLHSSSSFVVCLFVFVFVFCCLVLCLLLFAVCLVLSVCLRSGCLSVLFVCCLVLWAIFPLSQALARSCCSLIHVTQTAISVPPDSKLQVPSVRQMQSGLGHLSQ